MEVTMKTEASSNPNESIRKLGELIKGIGFAMFTTVDFDGNLYSRPMATQEIDFDGDLWFFSGKSTAKIRSIEKDQHVNVSFSDPSNNKYVSVSGKAETIYDRSKMEELWSPLFKNWFPEGLEDPDLTLIRVRVESAEYWDSPSKMIVRLVGFAKALAGGGRIPMGDHQKVQLPH
jgi:general stress protein 26